METDAKEAAFRNAIASGVFIEFRDAHGNSVGQAAYLDWRGQPLPKVGDTLSADVAAIDGNRATKLIGRVQSRQFDVQAAADGGAAVWVHLVACVADRSAARGAKRQRRPFAVTFSNN
jgi:hypothetical protein